MNIQPICANTNPISPLKMCFICMYITYMHMFCGHFENLLAESRACMLQLFFNIVYTHQRRVYVCVFDQFCLFIKRSTSYGANRLCFCLLIHMAATSMRELFVEITQIREAIEAAITRKERLKNIFPRAVRTISISGHITK